MNGQTDNLTSLSRSWLILPAHPLPRRLSARPLRLFCPPSALRRPSRPSRRLGLVPHLLRRATVLPTRRRLPARRMRRRRRQGMSLLLGIRVVSGSMVKGRARVKVLHDGDGRELFLVRVLMLALAFEIGRCRCDASP